MTPVFAVVGHPNKGKSSIVATLAQNDSIAISSESGTTQNADELSIHIGSSHYKLIDTPGFQRPTRVLKWLQQHASSAEKRQDAVKLFTQDSNCQQEFPDEVELLTPIINGAAILYVVDGSRPYGPEYEAEMEILRWTGQASMALINPIENDNHIGAWEQALGQYFKVVRVFNAMEADFQKQIAVLEAFSLLKQEWQESINALISEYRKIKGAQRLQSVTLLAELLTKLCAYHVSQVTLNKDQALLTQPVLEKKYFSDMRNMESSCHDELKKIYHYNNLQTEIYELPLDSNLFDTEKWIVWGLNRKQLTTAASMAGAAAGAVIDVAVGGSSLLLGTLGGGLIGGGSAWMGADKIAKFKVKGLPVGGFEARQGPIQNRNFPYVLIGRYLFLEDSLRNRTHARRDSISINENDLTEKLALLSAVEQGQLHRALNRLTRQKSVDDLQKVLQPLII